METKNLDIYGHEPIPWTRARDALAASRGPEVPFFLATVRPDATPHVAGIGALWVDDTLWFVSGPRTRKSRNLAANPACAIAVRLPGLDVVLEGHAERVTDTETLERLVATYREVGWPAEVEGDAFTAPYSAPSAGPPPWHLYRFTFHTAFGLASEEPHGATRWKFPALTTRGALRGESWASNRRSCLARTRRWRAAPRRLRTR
jgi:Pyridoxamine 5'-phosphate oxidase